MEMGIVQKYLVLTILVMFCTPNFAIEAGSGIRTSRSISMSSMSNLARLLFGGDMFAPFEYHLQNHQASAYPPPPGIPYPGPTYGFIGGEGPPGTYLIPTTVQHPIPYDTNVPDGNALQNGTEPVASEPEPPVFPQSESDPHSQVVQVAGIVPQNPEIQPQNPEIQPEGVPSYEEPQQLGQPILDNQLRANYPLQGPPLSYPPAPIPVTTFGHYSAYPPYHLVGIFRGVPADAYENHHGAVKYHPVPPPPPQLQEIVSSNIVGSVENDTLTTSASAIENPSFDQQQQQQEYPPQVEESTEKPSNSPPTERPPPPSVTKNVMDSHYVNTNSHFNNNKGFQGNRYDSKPSMAMTPPLMPPTRGGRYESDGLGGSLIGRLMSSYMRAFMPGRGSSEDSFFHISEE